MRTRTLAAVTGLLAAAAVTISVSTRAGDHSWSIGLGIHTGGTVLGWTYGESGSRRYGRDRSRTSVHIGYGTPVVVRPAPVIVTRPVCPPPVVIHPAPVIVTRPACPPPVVFRPAPVVIRRPSCPPPVVIHPRYHRDWRDGRHHDDRYDRRHGGRRDERHGRHDRDGRRDRGDRHDSHHGQSRGDRHPYAGHVRLADID